MAAGGPLAVKRGLLPAIGLALGLVLTGCTGSGSGPGESSGPRVVETAPPVSVEPTALRALRPSAAELAEAARQVEAMTLAERAGQVIVARYRGTSAPVDLVEELHLGGVIVFSDNITSTDQIRESNQRLRAEVDRPLMISVDQEGGQVARVKAGATEFPTFMSAGAAGDVDLTRNAARASAAELADLGFTTAYAPIADVTSGPDDPTIGSRSPGSDPAVVADQAVAAATGIAEAGLLPVPKHFPGHGSVPADSHHELPVQDRTRAELDGTDLVPFREAVAAGVPTIMVGHIDVRAIDPGTPASLSGEVVTGLLRDDLGFDGLVMTDAVEMAGVQAGHRSGEASVLALAAGVDVVLMPPDPRVARAAIVAAVESGDLPAERLDEAATRMLAQMIHLAATETEQAAPGSGEEASRALSAGAITVVAGPCEGNLVPDGITVVGSSQRARRLEAAARAAGVPLGRGKTVALAGPGRAAPRADIVVATDTPYVLGRSDAPVRIATYGETPAAMEALVAVLTGRARAPGTLPVEVDGVERTGC
ncbi:glycoside hydrolase family 3 N-terminal domain-containing protein [Nocardioides sp. AE5]|uniref:glycoside hydrolase family 3 N-terminal domain-containing protein n=1 Tax=Nocardioides sp. AE5 TaxID=2962573 RepID=UPI002880DDDA|nr:glycoside hydrolase family 3 N-terminal domain-containing protein [Nocardioides sp. AE5]MDT0202045.1 glycoside hydrolase family 3 N-terminal domain-containing protein [Nocardioides sp. AE5]